jgi:hypothetical protein
MYPGLTIRWFALIPEIISYTLNHDKSSENYVEPISGSFGLRTSFM